MFEQAVREKIRFDYRGNLSVEDLWDLSETDLNQLYVKLSKLKKESEGEALINSREDKGLKLKMDIVKHIFEAKREEAKKAKVKAALKAKKQKILEVLHKKGEEDLENKSVEELEAMLIEEDDE